MARNETYCSSIPRDHGYFRPKGRRPQVEGSIKTPEGPEIPMSLRCNNILIQQGRFMNQLQYFLQVLQFQAIFGLTGPKIIIFRPFGPKMQYHKSIFGLVGPKMTIFGSNHENFPAQCLLSKVGRAIQECEIPKFVFHGRVLLEFHDRHLILKGFP